MKPATIPMPPGGAMEASAVHTGRLSARDWIWLHVKIGLFSFGHGAIMPMYERTLVQESKMMTPEEFHEALTVALVLPGPSLITLSMYLGRHLFGTAVGLLGVLGMCIPGALWALVVIALVPIHHAAVRALFQGFTIGALVLLVDMVRRLQRGLRSEGSAARARDLRYVARLAIAAGVCALALLHVPMTQIAVLGTLVCLSVEFLR